MCAHRVPKVYCMYKHTPYCTVYGGFIIELMHVYVWLTAQVRQDRQCQGDVQEEEKEQTQRRRQSVDYLRTVHSKSQ